MKYSFQGNRKNFSASSDNGMPIPGNKSLGCTLIASPPAVRSKFETTGGVARMKIANDYTDAIHQGRCAARDEEQLSVYGTELTEGRQRHISYLLVFK
jgi:hypothetical protein